jgi:hypothetical protein
MPTLKYCKVILQKVSFDKDLFEKELRKSINLLSPEDSQNLLSWALVHYGNYCPGLMYPFKKIVPESAFREECRY